MPTAKHTSSALALLATLAALTSLGCQTTSDAPPPQQSAGGPTQQQQRQMLPPAQQASQAVTSAQQAQSRGDIEAALVEFERAIAINPELTVAYMGAGDIYLGRGDYTNAERRYAVAAQQAPRNFDAQYNHGLTLQFLNRLAEAVRAYLRALSINPNSFDANLNLATTYLDLSEPAQALPYAQRAVQIDAGSGTARFNLGAAYAALGRHDQAVIEYQQAAERMDLTPELLLNLSDALGKTGRNAEMLGALQTLVAIEPSAIAYERTGAAYFKLRRYDESLQAFDRAIQLDPLHYPALNGLAVNHLNRYLWSNQNDRASLQRAIDALRRSLVIEPNQPRIQALLTRYG